MLRSFSAFIGIFILGMLNLRLAHAAILSFGGNAVIFWDSLNLPWCTMGLAAASLAIALAFSEKP